MVSARGNTMKLLPLFLLIFLISPVSAITEIPAGSVSSYSLDTTDETYALQGDVTATDTAFLVAANGITLDGNGHTITYATTSNGYAFSNAGYDNVTIKNVSIVQNSAATVTYPAIKYSAGSTGGLLDHVTLNTNVASGLSMNASSVVTMRDCSLNTEGSAVTATYSSSLYAYDSSFASESGAGAALSVGDGLTAERCTFTSGSDSLHALSMSDRTDSVLSDVQCSSNIKNGLYMYNCVNTVANNVSASSDNTYGAWIRSSTNATFSDSQFSSVDEAGSTIVDCTDIDGAGCTFTSTDKIGVRLSNSADCNFTGTIVHSPLANTSTDGKKHLMLDGDSITEGSAALIYGGYQIFMPATLGSRYAISNQGIGGTHADYELKTIQAKLEIFHPDVVTIMIGTNDIASGRAAQDTVNDVIAMADICKASGAKVFIGLTPARLVPSEAAFVEYVTLLKSTAEANGYPVINAFDVIDTAPYNSVFDSHNDTNYLSDNVHPNTIGNTLLGQAFSNEILASEQIYSGIGLTCTVNNSSKMIYNRGIKPTDVSTNFTVYPSEGNLTVHVNSWSTSGTYLRSWNESSTVSTANATHAIGGFPVDTDIQIKQNGTIITTVKSNDTGYLNWVYDGGFSEQQFTALVNTPDTLAKRFWFLFSLKWWLGMPLVV